MKGLLQSKRFRKNLFKWLFMYIGVMALFTSVVTYSKYISNMHSSDQARVAKFTYKVACDGIDSNVCNTGVHRLTKPIIYEFVLDTSQLEVSTKFTFAATVSSNFSYKIYESLNNKDFSDVTLNESGTISSSWNYTHKVGSGPDKIYYRIEATFKEDINKHFNGEQNIVSISYDAEQIK